MRTTMQYLSVIALCLLLATLVQASGSDSKESDDSKSDKMKQATEAYNAGVMHMDKAQEAIKKGDSTFAYNYRATSDAKAKKEYEKAVEKFEETTELNPKMKEAHNNLGYCYRKLGMLDKSLASYEKALEIDPNFAQAREYLGETYLALGQMDKAMAQYSMLKEMESPYADTLNQSIELFKLKGFEKQLQETKPGK